MRFVGRQGQTRFGQPINSSIDVGLAVAAGEDVEVNVIDGDVYTGTVTNEKDTIKQVCSAASDSHSLPAPLSNLS